ncbi:MAG: hypothetical protein ACMV0Y_02665 [Paludibacter sp.]
MEKNLSMLLIYKFGNQLNTVNNIHKKANNSSTRFVNPKFLSIFAPAKAQWKCG